MNLKVPKIYFNAEFQRLIWLNFSLPLFFMILCCYGVFGYSFITHETGMRFENLQYVANGGFWLSNFAMLIMLQRSFKQDIQSQFWDQLRMSTLTSWQLSWTRLFITPILAWLSIMVCMMLMYFGVILYTPSAEYHYTLLYDELMNHIIPFVLMMPMLSMIVGSVFIINELQFKRSQFEWNGTYFQLGLLIVAVWIFFVNSIERFSRNSTVDISPFFYRDYFNIWPIFTYMLLFTVIALFLLNKSMAYKLYLKSTHVYWLVISLFLPLVLIVIDALYLPNTLYFSQYDGVKEKWVAIPFDKTAILFYYFTVYSVVIYSIVSLISLVCQDNRPAIFKLSMQYLKAKQWRKVLDILPTWVILFPVALITIGLLSFIIPMIDTDFYQTIIQQNHYDDSVHFDFMNFAVRLASYMLTILGLYQLSIRFFPRFNGVSLSLIGFILLYVMWRLVLGR